LISSFFLFLLEDSITRNRSFENLSITRSCHCPTRRSSIGIELYKLLLHSIFMRINKTAKT